MPVELRFGPDDLLRCRFAVSPLCETHESVRTLGRPRRHAYHVPWLRRVRAAAAGLDLAPLLLFMPAHGGYTPDFLAPPPGAPLTASVSFEEELARLRATDPAVAHAEMARSLACTAGAASSPEGRAMLDDPARAVRRLADITRDVWQALVRPHWPRLRPLLEADIVHRSRILADGGLENLFSDLHPGLSWSGGVLSVNVPGASPEPRDLAGRGLLLMPSVFAWPNVVSGFAPRWQPTVIYPARGMGRLWQAPAGPPDALVRLLGPNRAAVLGELDEPASTTALADRLGLAAASVSAHLSVLRDAGLLVSHRAGRHVLYERTPLGAVLAGGPRGTAGGA